MPSGYTLRRISTEDAGEIYGWHYGGDYAFYDLDRHPEDFDEILAPDGREEFYSVLGPDGELVGFFSFTDEGDGGLTIGLGMRPDLTGRGLGEEFVRCGLAFGRDELGAGSFGLSVAAFNERAIRVYERVGFRAGETFMRLSGGEWREFLRMTLD